MARPIITFELNNKSESKFTNYQQLLFRYLIGSLTLEPESSFKEGKIHIVTTYNAETKSLKMQFNGVNNVFLIYLVGKFPIPILDINSLGNSALLVSDYTLKIETQTVKTISITK